MKTILLLVLMTIHITTSKPLSTDIDLIIFPESENSQTIPEKYSQFSKSEKECYRKGQVLFNGQCEPLLKNNACPDFEWLILDYESAKLPQPQIRPKCARRLCPVNLHYWPHNGKCYSKHDGPNLCPRGNELVDDVFGDGVCKCKEDPPHGAVKNGTCYRLYTKGPCMSQLVFVENDNGETDCIPDKCSAEIQKLPENITMVYLEEEKRCYKLGDTEPCPAGKQVKIDNITKKPKCGEPTKVVTLHLVNPPSICGTDHRGQCATEIMPQRTDEQFVAALLAQADRKRNKRKLNIS